ncbi:DnaB-like helicase N-terminal domain-containing protein [Micromonospora sp. NPDC048986]|uniref:DnaB-like helicase N-terminal domain-containing protein n=1 Tax=Micromonospora sp. NPDC048986 TaxID=3155644 RepID=UPI0033CF1175
MTTESLNVATGPNGHDYTRDLAMALGDMPRIPRVSAERWLIGAMFAFPPAINHASWLLTYEDFCDDHQAIAREIFLMNAEGIAVTPCSLARRLNPDVLTAVGGQDYLHKLHIDLPASDDLMRQVHVWASAIADAEFARWVEGQAALLLSVAARGSRAAIARAWGDIHAQLIARGPDHRTEFEVLRANDGRTALTALYRWYDTADRLLYVGITGNTDARQSSHARRSSWSEFAVRGTIERFPSRPEAEAAERKAIESEQPLFNGTYNDTPEARARLVAYLIEHGRTDLLAPAVSRG